MPIESESYYQNQIDKVLQERTSFNELVKRRIIGKKVAKIFIDDYNKRLRYYRMCLKKLRHGI